MIYTSGDTAKTDNLGSIDVRPNVHYHVRFEILRNDLGGSHEKVTGVLVDGEDLGECNPDGSDYDCTFYDCSSQQLSKTIISTTGKVDVNMKITGHSWDCDCDTKTWACSDQYDYVAGREKMTAVGIFVLTPIGDVAML